MTPRRSHVKWRTFPLSFVPLLSYTVFKFPSQSFRERKNCNNEILGFPSLCLLCGGVHFVTVRDLK